MTIRVRLTTWYVVVGATTLILLGALVWLQYAGALRRSVEAVLQVQANAARELIEADPLSRPDVGSLERGLFLVVVDRNGRPTYVSPGAPAVGRPATGFTALRTGPTGTDEIFTVEAANGELVVAGTSVADVDRNLDNLTRTLVLVGAAAAVVLVLGGWWLAGRALAPVTELTRQADAIDSTELHQRLPEPARRDELGALTRTLNRMLGRVEEAVRRQRAFVIGASHDLRTPLTALRTELELALVQGSDEAALREAVLAAHDDAVRLSELATGLLRLADAESAGRPLDRQPVELQPLVRDSVGLAAKAGKGRGVRIDSWAPDAVVRVDRSRLEQAIVNLLTNAVRFAPDHSKVELGAIVASEPAGPVLRIEVLDRGPGVAVDLRATLFEPFVRTRTDGATGMGLGLATAAAAVRAHGGTIGFEDRPGGGSRFWFSLPA